MNLNFRIKNIIRPIYYKIMNMDFVSNMRKKMLVIKMQKKHQQLIEKIKGKKKIKVVFLAIHKSVWKVDPVFKKMLDDPFFEPIVLVCPYTTYGDERMWEDMKDTYEYFEDKGYPLISSYNKDEDRWISLEEIKPDIVFFTNPHDLTRKEYYEDAYMNYLSCYVPYYFMATTHAGDNTSLYNTQMLNSMWHVFWPHEYVFNEFKKHSMSKGTNSLAIGFPACEVFIGTKSFNEESVWKPQINNKKRIIYAPHHTINEDQNSLSSFIKLAEPIMELCTKYQDNLQWAFKPHPILKSKLYLHPNWGVKKTDSYYNFWENQQYTQLETGEYEKLFIQSDAIIHDSSSFLVEYAFLNKPALYTISPDKAKVLVNDFGKLALVQYEVSNQLIDIENFLLNFLENNISSSKSIEFKNYLNNFYYKQSPSESIVKTLKNEIYHI